jgi:hypothetical protein
MANKITKIIGALLLVIMASGIIYISMGGVQLKVEKTKTTFNVKENNLWVVSGIEYNKLYSGTKLLKQNTTTSRMETVTNSLTKEVYITRYANFPGNIQIKDTYYFRGNNTDPELFPVSHKIEIINASGKNFRYEVRNLVYSGPTYSLTNQTLLTFGRNMQLELNSGYTWAKIYASKYVAANYKVNSDHETFYMRFFDPTVHIYLNGVEADRRYEYGTTINITATTASGNVNISIYDSNEELVIPVVELASTAEYNYTIDLLRIANFSDKTKTKTCNVQGCEVNITLDRNHIIDVKNLTINISSSNNPENITISQNGVVIFEFPGVLNGTSLVTHDFRYNNLWYNDSE